MAAQTSSAGAYNSLQVSLKKRYSNGLQFNMSYTWQKSLDNQSSLAENQKTQDPFDRQSDWSRSSWDINHVFIFAYVYELPFGRGRSFGGNWNKAADMLLGGWSLEGLTRFDSGPPFMVYTGKDIANTGRKTQRMNQVGDPNAGPKTPDEFFNTVRLRGSGCVHFRQRGTVHYQCRQHCQSRHRDPEGVPDQ